MPDGIDYIVEEITRKLLLAKTYNGGVNPSYAVGSILETILENDIPQLIKEIKNGRAKEK